jgi:HEPN domain-containing protein
LPRKTDSNNPADWILIVEFDMEALRAMVRQELGYNLCRSKLAEVVEKIIKAELIRTGWNLEKTHDLEKLFEMLVERGSDLKDLCAPLCAGLAEAYFTDRYPGFDLDDPDWPKLRGQFQQVEELLAKVKSRLPTPGVKPAKEK